MKKYKSIGQLIKDYRRFHAISQSDLAIKLSVDVRTVQRWENERTLLKDDKVSVLVETTLLPIQLITNLNINKAIPTYYSFELHRYTLSKLTIDLPDASWYKKTLKEHTDRIRAIDLELDFEFLASVFKIPIEYQKNIKSAFKEALLHIPEINVIIKNELGFYSGALVLLPITEEAYTLLRDRKINRYELRAEHICDPEFQDKKFFFEFELTADNNDDGQYLIVAGLRFFDELKDQDYLYCSFDFRKDSSHLAEQTGLEIIWQDTSDHLHLRFCAGDFKAFFKNE